MRTIRLQTLCALMATTRCCFPRGLLGGEVHVLWERAVHWGSMSRRVPVSWSQVHWWHWTSPSHCEQTDTSEGIIFPQLRWWAVKRKMFYNRRYVGYLHNFFAGVSGAGGGGLGNLVPDSVSVLRGHPDDGDGRARRSGRHDDIASRSWYAVPEKCGRAISGDWTNEVHTFLVKNQTHWSALDFVRQMVRLSLRWSFSIEFELGLLAIFLQSLVKVSLKKFS